MGGGICVPGHVRPQSMLAVSHNCPTLASHCHITRNQPDSQSGVGSDLEQDVRQTNNGYITPVVSWPPKQRGGLQGAIFQSQVGKQLTGEPFFKPPPLMRGVL